MEERVASKKQRNGIKRSMDDPYEKWAERANKIGTLAELIVSPRIPEIAWEYFGDDDFDFFGHQIQKRNMKDRSLRRDFDIVAATEKNFFVINTTSYPSPEGADNFSAMLEGLPDYFPECKGKKIIPILSALRFPEEIQKKLTRRGIFAMGMVEGTMDLLNFEQVSERN